MEFDERMLYDKNGDCNLCGCRSGAHKPRCPGAVIDGLKYEVTYNSDASDDEGAVGGKTLDECIENAANALLSSGQHYCRVRYVFEFDMPGLDACVHEARMRLVEKHRADEAKKCRIALEQRRMKALAELATQRSDFTLEAYERRRAEIEAHE